VNHPFTGDEPHYLLMDYSLAHDRDLNLKNNFQNHDYWSFYPNPIEPKTQIGGTQVSDDAEGWYSIHAIGLPFLLLPLFMVAGPWATVVAMVAIATIVIWLTWVWTLSVTKNRKMSFLASGVLLTCYFFNGLAGYLYPDMCIAALSLAALIILKDYYRRSAFQVSLGLILGFMVLLHFKTLALVAPLLLVVVYKTWRNGRTLPWLVFLPVLPFLTFFIYSTHHWFGVWNPTDIYQSLSLTYVSPFAIASGLLFDSMRGLLVNIPSALLIFVGAPLWYKKHRSSFLITAVSVGPSLLVLMTFSQWQGGDAPIGRYVVGSLPVFMPAVAFAVHALWSKPWQKVAIVVLLGTTLMISTTATLIKRPYVRYDTRSPIFVRIERSTGLGIDKLLPTFTDQTKSMYPHGKDRVLVGYVLLAVVTLYGYKLSRNAKPIHQPRRS